MHELVAQYIEKKEKAQREKYQNQKAEFLLREGLTEKVCSPYEEYNDEYPESEWDEENRKRIFYKKAPIEISDEEYEQLRKLCDEEKDVAPKKGSNSIATLLSIIGWIEIICGFIVIMVGLDALIAWGVFAGALISSCFVFGFSEIIKLLQAIKNKEK